MKTTLILLILGLLLRPTFSQDKQLYKLPSGPKGPGKFGAYYTQLKYDPAWDKAWRVGEHPDVVVRFDDGGHKFVFWRGTSFIPCWVTDNDIWYTNEFVERRGWHSPNTEGCVEPMSDKQCRYSHVRIIESNDARAVIHWRYAPVDVHYEHPFIDGKSGWADWVDEYYIIYPNATGVRSITVQSTNLKKWIEFHEAIVVNQPGTVPDDNIKPGAVSVANMKGEHHTYVWGENGGPVFDQNPARANMYKINLKSNRGPFALIKPPKVDGDIITSYLGHSRKSIFNWWDHWPVSQVALDGRGAKSSDNPSHTSLCHIAIPKHPPITCYAPIGDDSYIRDGALEWLTSSNSEISMAFYETTNLGDSIVFSFEYADLWTNELLLTIYDWKNNTIATELSQFGDEFTLNESEFKKFEKKIYLADSEDYEEFGNIREVGLTLPDTKEKKIIRIDNLKIVSNFKNKNTNLHRFFDFNLPDGSSPDEIVIKEQPEWEPSFKGETKITRLMLHGLTDKNVEDLVPMAKSWSDPAKLVIQGDGFENKGYDPEQMAYVIEAQQSGKNTSLEFTLSGTNDSPVIDPAIVIKNWDIKSFDLEINGKKMSSGDGYRYGIESSLEGNYLVFWSKMASTKPAHFKLINQIDI
jgi:hypothetical protein